MPIRFLATQRTDRFVRELITKQRFSSPEHLYVLGPSSRRLSRKPCPRSFENTDLRTKAGIPTQCSCCSLDTHIESALLVFESSVLDLQHERVNSSVLIGERPQRRYTNLLKESIDLCQGALFVCHCDAQFVTCLGKQPGTFLLVCCGPGFHLIPSAFHVELDRVKALDANNGIKRPKPVCRQAGDEVEQPFAP